MAFAGPLDSTGLNGEGSTASQRIPPAKGYDGLGVEETTVNAIAAMQPLHAPAKARATALLRSLKGELAALGISEVWLFGSVALGDDGPDSDIDIAIKVGAIKVGEGQKYASVVKFSAARFLQQRLGRPVDMALLPFGERLATVASEDLVRVI